MFTFNAIIKMKAQFDMSNTFYFIKNVKSCSAGKKLVAALLLCFMIFSDVQGQDEKTYMMRPLCSTAPDSITATSTTVCVGQSVMLTQNGGVLGTNGNFYWYELGCGGTLVGTGASINVSPLVNTTYHVRAEDSCGVTTCASITITVIPLPSAVMSANSAICSGDCTNIMISFSGPGPFTYSYTDGVTTFGPFTTSANPTIFQVCPTATTNYTLTSLANPFCFGTVAGSATITVNQLPSPAITGNNTFCQGNSTTLNAGTGYTSYIWSNAAITQTINISTPGTYTVTVTDVNGCTGSSSVVVTVAPPPVVNLGSDVSICVGNSVQLDAGWGYACYIWSNGANTQTINISTSGVYYVTVCDANGCTGTDNINVIVYPLPLALITPDAAVNICLGDTVHFTANTGAGYTYQWFKNGNIIAGAVNSFYDAAHNGFYSVEITNNGCTGTSSFTQVHIVCFPPLDPELRTTNVSTDDEVVLIPNPASDYFELRIGNFGFEKEVRINITDVLGKNIYTQSEINNPKSAIKVSISHLFNGIYFVTIADGSKKAVKKLIKN